MHFISALLFLFLLNFPSLQTTSIDICKGKGKGKGIGTDLDVSSPAAVDLFGTNSNARGLELLFLFWFDRADTEFNRLIHHNSTSISNMALWGSAMAQKQPLWHSENLTAAQRYLDMLSEAHWNTSCAQSVKDATLSMTGSVEIDCKLIEGAFIYLDRRTPAPEREQAYMTWMEQVYTENKTNLDVIALYSFAILGHAANAPNSISQASADILVAKAQSLLQQTYDEMPCAQDHAGILHAITHAFDSMDPLVARRGVAPGLKLAERYGFSTHAVHMVSHLFLAMSQWEKVEDMNRKAYSVSKRYCLLTADSAALLQVKCDQDDKFHAFEWVHYSMLQTRPCGGEARDMLVEMDSYLSLDPGNVGFQQWVLRMYARDTMAALFCSAAAATPTASVSEYIPTTLSVKVSLGDECWIPAPFSTLDYWSLYSESGALFARYIVLMQSTSLSQQTNCIDRIRHRFSVLVAASRNQTFIDKLISSYELAVREEWHHALDLECENARTPAAPTLPIAPVSSVYALHLVRDGVDPSDSSVVALLNQTRSVWGNRAEIALFSYL